MKMKHFIGNDILLHFYKFTLKIGDKAQLNRYRLTLNIREIVPLN
jgi:hypothetical protein